MSSPIVFLPLLFVNVIIVNFIYKIQSVCMSECMYVWLCVSLLNVCAWMVMCVHLCVHKVCVFIHVLLGMRVYAFIKYVCVPLESRKHSLLHQCLLKKVLAFPFPISLTIGSVQCGISGHNSHKIIPPSSFTSLK